MGNWSHIENPGKGTVNILSDYIYKLENTGMIFLPDLRQEDTLYFFSDYSGSKDQQLISYSILVLDENSFNSFVSVQKSFWKDYSLGTRIIDYKGLNDRIKKKALIPFLRLCNNLNGLLFTVIFHKSTKSIYKGEIPEYLQRQISVWKSKAVQEKFLRLRDLMVLTLSGLGRKSQKILWITDNDDIVANELQLRTANVILKDTLGKYLGFDISQFDLKSLDADSSDRHFEKLCSLSDLVAGGLVDFLGDYHKENQTLKEGEIAPPISHTKLKVNPITNWLSKNEEKNMLKKITIKVNEIDNDNLSVEAYRFPEF